MLLKLIYNTKIQPWESVERTLKLLAKIKEKYRGEYDFEIIDTNNLSDQELYDLYTEAMIPSVKKKYQIRQIFGSKRYSGSFFGKQQPALLVYEESKYPADTFPHIKGTQKITIDGYLGQLFKEKV